MGKFSIIRPNNIRKGPKMERVLQQLDAAKRIGPKGGEYWMARGIQEILGYTKWENFYCVVKKAVESCRQASIDPKDHFLGYRKMVSIGSGAKVEVEDAYLTRYACYLTAMNGNPSKPEIAAAQSYFAVQTRLQELDRHALNNQERLRVRKRLTEATKHLNQAAAGAGVQNYAFFHQAGYHGLYEMGLREIKKQKGISEKDDLFDRAGRLELSANEFKANLTEQSLITKNIKGQKNAENEHKRVGKVVRDTIHREIGKYPEDLPAELPIKIIEGKEPKQLPPIREQ